MTGLPKCRAITGDHATRNPQFDGRNGATSTPSAERIPAHAPSDPSRAQDPPPSASTVARAATPRAPPGVAKTAAPSRHPSHRQRVRTSTPAPSSLPSHARSNGDAFISRGNTRPELPVNTSTPSPRAQSCTAPGPNPASIGPSHAAPST